MSCNAATTKLARLGFVASLALLCCLSSVSYAVESPLVGPSGTALPAENGTSVVTDQYEFSQYTSPLFVFPSGGDFDLTGYLKHLVSVNTVFEDDFIHKIYGSADLNAAINVPEGMYNDYFGGATAGSSPCINEYILSNTYTYDSWVGIGLSCAPSFISNEEDVTIEESGSNIWSDNFQIETFFSGNSGPVAISMDDANSAGSWYLPSTTATNGFAGEDCKSVVMQVTSQGSISWTLNAEIWVHGDENNKVILTQTFDGESLGAPIIEGCTDTDACNYYDLATSDNGSCDYPETYYDCAGVCLADTDEDGVCNEFEVLGCDDSDACNYNSAATDASDDCIYATGCESCSGETNGTGTIVANDDDEDGVCNSAEIAGCQAATACNYNAAATDAGACVYVDGICESCSGETDGTGTVVDNDQDNDEVCDADEVEGCQDPVACNYMAAATDPSACIYATGCDYCSGEDDGSGEVLDGDVDGDGICNTDEVPGCQDVTACNYNGLATDSDDSCQFCGCSPTTGLSPYSLTIEEYGEDLIAGHTTYRLYVNMDHPNDYLSAIYGEGTDHAFALTSTATPNWYNDADFNADYATQLMPAILAVFPDAAYDSWFTFGADSQNFDLNIGSADATGTFWTDFNAGNDILVNDAGGFSIYNTRNCTLPPGVDGSSCDANYPALGGDDGRVLMAQITSAGQISGEFSVQIIQNGIYEAGVYEAVHFVFDGEGTFSANDWTGAMASNYQDCGCTDSEALNFDGEALYDDGGCIPNIPGCMDATACNYDASATSDSGDCLFPDGICDACSGESDGTGSIVDNDADDDGVCDSAEVVGCQDNTACNFNAAATDAGDCVFPDGICETCSGDTDGTGTVIDNDSDNDEVCDADEVVGCQDETACDYNSLATDAGDCTFPDGICDTCSGETDGTGTIVDNDTDNDGVCDLNELVGCQDATACNYNTAATDAGDCVYPDGICETCSGETDGSGVTVDNDTDNDGVCDLNELVGCQDATACNYNTAATDAGDCVYADDICETCSGETDGSGTIVDNDADNDEVCDLDEVAGCQDLLACNYNASATDGGVSCEYAIGPCAECIGTSDDGTGSVLSNDADEDGVCDVDEVPGCQNSDACNYNAGATDEDGSCIYATGCDSCSGATDGTGTVQTNDDDTDGVCNADEIAGCQDSLACNYNESATDPGVDCLYPTGCESCSGAMDGTGVILANDADNDQICDADEVVGCMNLLACNYDPSATDPGECYVAGEFYGCDGECLNDENGNGICDEIDLLISTADFNGYAEGYTDGLEAGLAQCIDGPVFCGEGTVWVESLQLCVEDSSCPGDLNGDNTVGTGDLLILLNDYGITCE